MTRGQAARDVGLVVLASVVMSSAGWVLLREPPQAAPQRLVSTKQAVAAATSSVPEALAPDAPFTAAVVRALGTPALHLVEAGRELGWQLSPTAPDEPVPPRDVVLVQTAEMGLPEVLAAIRSVRSTAPDARLVVLAPVRAGLSPQDLALVAAATAAAGGELVDPVALGWTTPEGTLQPDGTFTPGGSARVGALLADQLR